MLVRLAAVLSTPSLVESQSRLHELSLKCMFNCARDASRRVTISADIAKVANEVVSRRKLLQEAARV